MGLVEVGEAKSTFLGGWISPEPPAVRRLAPPAL